MAVLTPTTMMADFDEDNTILGICVLSISNKSGVPCCLYDIWLLCLFVCLFVFFF